MKDERPIRIFISGCSGVGKTTLAKAAAKVLGMTYTSTSASEVWPEFGISSHAEAINLGPEMAIKYQRRINDVRLNKLRALNEHVITDRGMMDNLVYLDDYHGSPHDKEILVGDIMDDFLQDLLNYRCLFIKLVKPFNWNTEENGKRISNELYQTYSNMKFVGLDIRAFMIFGKNSRDKLRNYYPSKDIKTMHMTMKMLGAIGYTPRIYIGQITTQVLQKRILGILQMLVNVGYIDQERFDSLYDDVINSVYDPKKFQ